MPTKNSHQQHVSLQSTRSAIIRRRSPLVPLVALLVAGWGCKENVAPRPALPPRRPPAVAVPAPPRVDSGAPVVRPQAALPREAPSQQAGGTSECDRLCRLAEPLRCTHAVECLPRCQSMAASPLCSPEIKGLFACLLRQPTTHWECDENGIGAIRDPYCNREQGRLAACLERSLER